jgi:hypothetical protein
VHPLAEFLRCLGEPALRVHLRQRGRGDGAGVVVERDERIELILGGRGLAENFTDFARVGLEILPEALVALRLGPDEALGDACPGGAPADRPWFAAGGGVRISLEAAVGAPFRAALEALDKRDPGAAERSRMRHGRGFGYVDRFVEPLDLALAEGAPEQAAHRIEDRFPVHR